MLTDFDVLGKTNNQVNTAWVETIAGVVVNDGVLTIAFDPVTQNPKISAIALYGSGDTSANQPSVANTSPDQRVINSNSDKIESAVFSDQVEIITDSGHSATDFFSRH